MAPPTTPCGCHPWSDRLSVVGIIASGGFGSVYTCTSASGELGAIKQSSAPTSIPGMVNEFDILSRLDHPNIIRATAFAHLNDVAWIHMEYGGGTTLFEMIDRRNVIHKALAMSWLSQACTGLAHLHAKRIAHRDIKLENMTITDAGVVKIIDFGLAYAYGASEVDVSLTEMVGSMSYACPCIISKTTYSGFVADVWSMGVVLFAWTFGFFPFSCASHKDPRFVLFREAQTTGASIGHGLRTLLSQYSTRSLTDRASTSLAVARLEGMLTVDPHSRVTMQQLTSWDNFIA